MPLRSLKYWTDELDKICWSKDFVDSGRNECFHLFFKCAIINIGAILMRRQLFIDAGKFDLQMPFSADWMLYAKMFMLADIAFTAEPLNYFRTNTTVYHLKEDMFLEARINILHYLCQNLQRPENFIEKIYDPIIGWWMRSIAPEKISLSRNLRIYRLLRDIDPSINYRLSRYIIQLIRKRLPSPPILGFLKDA